MANQTIKSDSSTFVIPKKWIRRGWGKKLVEVKTEVFFIGSMSPFTKRRTGRCTTQSYKHCLFQAEYFRPKSCLKIEEISISYFCKLMLPLPWIVDEWHLIFANLVRKMANKKLWEKIFSSCAVRRIVIIFPHLKGILLICVHLVFVIRCSLGSEKICVCARDICGNSTCYPL